MNVSANETVLVLRTCNADMTSYGGFIWPESGYVEAPDWDGGLDKCGGKLHGFLWGEGRGGLANWNEDAKWLVVSVDPAEGLEITVEGGGKYGFRRGCVVFCGSRDGATQYILTHGAKGRAVIGALVVVGDRGTAIAGEGGTATAGEGGTATAGDRGAATAGDRGTATAGEGGTATAGEDGTATVGNDGIATAGDRGVATAGDRGTATAGDRGAATAGNDGIATVGEGGTATAGEGGIIVIKRWDGSRDRLVVGYVGEDGINPGVPYRLDRDGQFVKA